MRFYPLLIATFLIFSNYYTSTCQIKINNLILNNLKSRYTNVEIVSITADSCPKLKSLQDLDSKLNLLSSMGRVKIAEAFRDLSGDKIDLDSVMNISNSVIDKVKYHCDEFNNIYFETKSEKCYIVKYRYANGEGKKITVEERYSSDPKFYSVGYDPLFENVKAENVIIYFKSLVEMYKELLLEELNAK